MTRESVGDAAVTATETADDSPVHVSPRARFEILGAVLLGIFLAALDQTIVGPVLPWDLVPHTGFRVNRLIRLSRVHGVPQRDA